MNFKHFIITGVFILLSATPSLSFAHNLYIKLNPTNEDGIVWGVNDAAYFSSWRAYIRCLSNNGQGDNSGWAEANGWWYYDLDSTAQRVMWRLNGLHNQICIVTYWLFREDGSWEYGEQREVVSDTTYSPPPPGSPSPVSNFRLMPYTEVGIHKMALFWTAPASFEGYRIYRDGILIEELPNNWVNWVDYHLEGNRYYCYVVSTYNSFGESPSSEVCEQVEVEIPEPEPEPEPIPEPPSQSPTAEGLRFPVNSQSLEHWESGTPGDDCWYDYQPHGSDFAVPGKLHVGVDINCTQGDYGVPVYAVGDCLVHDYSDTEHADGWGKWIALRCDAPPGQPYFLTDGRYVETLYFLYAHLKDIYLDGAFVEKGDKIGTIGDGNGGYSSHLHFACMLKGSSDLIPGRGYLYQSDPRFTEDHCDPLGTIENNRSLITNRSLTLRVHPYQTHYAVTWIDFDQPRWRHEGRTLEDGYHSVGFGNNYWTITSDVVTEASWRFMVPRAGRWSIQVYVPRKSAGARGVKYHVWHDDPSFENPYVLYINQLSDNENKKMYLGEFLFNEGMSYAVVLHSDTVEERVSTVTMDTLELHSYVPEGVGGGITNSYDHDGDMMPTVWEQKYGLNPFSEHDAYRDEDLDGLTNLIEYRAGTNPQLLDSDGDGLSDSLELHEDLDPVDPIDAPPFCEQEGNQEVCEGGLNEGLPEGYSGSNDSEIPGCVMSSTGSLGPILPLFIAIAMMVLGRRRR